MNSPGEKPPAKEQGVTEEHSLSRRTFLAATTGAVVAANLPGEEAIARENGAKLALHGGAKAVTGGRKLPIRWGNPEREQLNEMLAQQALFYWKGPRTELLIERFRKICPLEHVMTCSSGTAALHIAVAAAGVGLGDEVITAPITDIGTVIGTIYQQGVPVFADLGASTYNLDVASVESLVTPRTKAIIAVHLAGNPCDMDALRKVADRHKLVLIEDCAQAWGAKYRGRPVGTIGDIACWSLQNSKHITCGDGGVVASSDKRFGPLLQKFGDKGFDRRKPGLFAAFSTNYRMSEPQAAVVAAQLERLEGIVSTRAELGNRLTGRISGLPGIAPHQVQTEDRCGYWFYMFRVDPKALKCDRAEFVKAVRAEGVPASAGYIPVPLFRNPVFLEHGFFAGRWPVREMGLTEMDYSKVQCPEAEAILQTGVRIRLHEAMDREHVDQIAEGIGKAATHYAA